MDGTAAVTGASRGLGAAVARRLAEEGMDVALCARTEEDVAAVAEAIEADTGASATATRADVRDEFDVERFVEAAARVGDPGIDLLVANAGVYHGSPGETPIDGDSYATFDDHLRTNVRGVFATIREALPHLTDGARVLVPTGSVARDPRPGLGSYAVSKAGAEAVMRQFAVDADPAVGCVDPGQVDTDLTGGPGRDPADVADMFVWAAGLDAEDLDGEVLDLRAWRSATR